VVGPPLAAERQGRSMPPKKNTSTDSHTIAPETPRASGLQVLVRILWMLIGNFVLAALAITIYSAKGFPSGKDVAFGVTVLFLLAIRYVDIRYLNGRTASDEPAGPKVYRNYAIGLLIISLVAWTTAHLVP
jgi:hypothetical protein